MKKETQTTDIQVLKRFFSCAIYDHCVHQKPSERSNHPLDCKPVVFRVSFKLKRSRHSQDIDRHA